MDDRAISGKVSAQPKTQTSQWAARIILLGVIVIVVSTLYPFKFTLSDHFPIRELFRGFRRHASVLDFVANVVLFAPVGFGFASALANRRSSIAKQLVTTVVICGGLSLTVESLQIFLPGRSPAIVDIVSNAIGGGVGFLCFQLVGKRLDQWSTATSVILRRVVARLSLFQLAWAIVFYVVFAGLSVNYWQSCSLRGWNPNFLLSIGNTDFSFNNQVQSGAGQPWNGSISDLVVSNRALSKPQVARFFANPQAFTQADRSVLAAYSLRGADGTQDSTGQSPDLVWRGRRSDPSSAANGAALSAEQWLQTSQPATWLNTQIRDSAEFTLTGLMSLSELAERSTQFHPVISISGLRGNNISLLLAQTELRLVMTVARTPRNHLVYEKTFSNVLLDTQPHRFVVTYSSFVLRMYLDGVEQLYLTDVTPSRYQIVFYLLILIPLVFLLVILINRLAHRLPLYLMLIGSSTILPPLMLEGLLASEGDRPIRLSNLLLGLLITGGTMVVFRSPRCRFNRLTLIR